MVFFFSKFEIQMRKRTQQTLRPLSSSHHASQPLSGCESYCLLLGATTGSAARPAGATGASTTGPAAARTCAATLLIGSPESPANTTRIGSVLIGAISIRSPKPSTDTPGSVGAGCTGTSRAARAKTARACAAGTRAARGRVTAALRLGITNAQRG
jgi:hypothetical protein